MVEMEYAYPARPQAYPALLSVLWASLARALSLRERGWVLVGEEGAY